MKLSKCNIWSFKIFEKISFQKYSLSWNTANWQYCSTVQLTGWPGLCYVRILFWWIITLKREGFRFKGFGLTQLAVTQVCCWLILAFFLVFSFKRSKIFNEPFTNFHRILLIIRQQRVAGASGRLYWRVKRQNQKPQVEICSLTLTFFNEN